MSDTTIQATRYNTPSHGYLEVTFADFNKIGSPVSAYSYRTASTVLLEEDCDMSRFLKKSRGDEH